MNNSSTKYFCPLAWNGRPLSQPFLASQTFCLDMARSNVFVLSSTWEGLPDVIVEALSCGISNIAIDCKYGLSEILENGLYGKLVPVGVSHRAMAKAILETIDILPDRNLLRKRSLDYTIEAAVQNYFGLFNSLLERNG